MADNSRPALSLEYTETAEAELEDAYRFMSRFGYTSAEKWLRGLTELLERECILQAALPTTRPAAAEQFPGRNVFVLRHVTRGGSPWRVLCELMDEDGDGANDVLRVVGIRHASANPHAGDEEEM